MLSWWLYCIVCAVIMTDADGGEGCWSATGPVELQSDLLVEGNSCGERPKLASGSFAKPDNSKHTTSAKKRSFRRAIRRISQHGYTWYRNQLMTDRDIPTHLRPQVTQHADSAFPNDVDLLPANTHTHTHTHTHTLDVNENING